MWTREYLKTRAKEVLKVTYWKAFVVSLILIFVGGDSGLGNSSSNIRNNHRNNIHINNIHINLDQIGNDFTPFYNWTLIVTSIIIAFIIFRILIGYGLEVGGRRFFKQAAQMDVKMGYLGYAFNSERYKGIMITMLYKGVLTFLWFLLLIIPGIIKSYAYSMVPYILADNPNIGSSRALELSSQMTEGHKFNIWVLELSFIGWYILGLILFYVGIFFVKPYENATKAELYLVLRQNALDNGYCLPEELLI